MKKLSTTLMMAVALIMGIPIISLGANTSKTYSPTVADTTIKITGDWDYTLKNSTPFGDNGYVDLVSTEHAVLIIEKVKPSATLKLLSHVLINGETAKDGTNCQVKLYNRGTIIMPYSKNIQPLTVYSGQNFEGEAVSSFGLENSGGYMNTLSEAKLNNKIRSFKLKRGFMVTFSTLPKGRGYSRCFIAANADLEVKSLPAVLDNHISSYRIFKWYDTSKVGLAAAAGDNAACSALNVTSTYSWNQGTNMHPDVEVVSHHIYEDYPSPAACGNVDYTPHMKTNNEPLNKSDDHPQDLATILANWENLMATGMRLCSPSSWDGSDYWNGTGFLKQFFDSIDARGWRCDIIDLHGYWTEGSFNTNIPNWYNAVKRPVWVSEWCWGASWNNNGAFANGATAAGLKSALQNICSTMNNQSYVERYFYWNGERDPSRIYKDGKLTPGGEYYATINSGVGYNGKHDFIPVAPKQKAASKLSVDFDKTTRTATVSWYDSNGEYNQEMVLERSADGKTWETIYTPTQKETPSSYSYTDNNVYDGISYRVRIKNLNGTTQNSAIITTQIANIGVGDAITVDGQPMYVGGNMLANSDFNQGLEGWTSGAGAPLAQPYFQAVPVAGPDGGTYLQAYGSKGVDDAASVKQYVAIQPNAQYVFRLYSRNGGNNMAVNLSTNNTSSGTQAVKFANTSEWQEQYKTFNSGTNSYAVITLSQLGAKAQFDKIELRQLFSSQEAALANGEAKPEPDPMALQAKVAKQTIDSLLTVTEVLVTYDFPNRDDLQAKADAARNATADADIISACEQLKEAVSAYCPMSEAANQPQSANFGSTTGWETKVGTYTGGDQRTNTVAGKPCWNAWWSNINASEGAAKTMEVRQTIEKLPEGLYALECKATTEHYCLSDQHGYLVYGDVTRNTPTLTYDYFDIPNVPDMWQTLTTPPIYVDEEGSVTIGFKSSKQGAVDNAWLPIGNASGKADKREGWWCATAFRLLYHPVKKMTVTPDQWSTICLEYATTIPQGVKCYRIAGILKDHTQICLEELTELAAGQAAILRSNVANFMFCEYGTAASEPISYSAQNNLRGYFRSGLASAGYYELVDGVWTALTARKRSGTNVAFLTSLDGLPEYDTWAGITLPIAAGEGNAVHTTRINVQPSTVYTLDGRRAANRSNLTIDTKGKKRLKVKADF